MLVDSQKEKGLLPIFFFKKRERKRKRKRERERRKSLHTPLQMISISSLHRRSPGCRSSEILLPSLPDMAESLLSMKLLIDTEGKRVVCAETNKDCVDFLFHMLSLPVATVTSLLKEQGMMGSLGNQYESIENLNESYIQPNQSKDTLLKPMRLYHDFSVPLLLLSDEPSKKQFYVCDNCRGYSRPPGVSDDPQSVCPSCNRKMTGAVPYVPPPEVKEAPDEGGFVKGLVTFMVTDNLVVKPMSTISCISLLNKLNVKEVGSLEEKVVNFGMNEAVRLLKASLLSQNVLTDVFLKHPMAMEKTDVGMDDNISVV